MPLFGKKSAVDEGRGDKAIVAGGIDVDTEVFSMRGREAAAVVRSFLSFGLVTETAPILSVLSLKKRESAWRRTEKCPKPKEKHSNAHLLLFLRKPRPARSTPRKKQKTRQEPFALDAERAADLSDKEYYDAKYAIPCSITGAMAV